MKQVLCLLLALWVCASPLEEKKIFFLSPQSSFFTGRLLDEPQPFQLPPSLKRQAFRVWVIAWKERKLAAEHLRFLHRYLDLRPRDSQKWERLPGLHDGDISRLSDLLLQVHVLRTPQSRDFVRLAIHVLFEGDDESDLSLQSDIFENYLKAHPDPDLFQVAFNNSRFVQVRKSILQTFFQCERLKTDSLKMSKADRRLKQIAAGKSYLGKILWLYETFSEWCALWGIPVPPKSATFWEREAWMRQVAVAMEWAQPNEANNLWDSALPGGNLRDVADRVSLRNNTHLLIATIQKIRFHTPNAFSHFTSFLDELNPAALHCDKEQLADEIRKILPQLRHVYYGEGLILMSALIRFAGKLAGNTGLSLLREIRSYITGDIEDQANLLVIYSQTAFDLGSKREALESLAAARPHLRQMMSVLGRWDSDRLDAILLDYAKTAKSIGGEEGEAALREARQMFAVPPDGDPLLRARGWICSIILGEASAVPQALSAIREIPYDPRPDYPLYLAECYAVALIAYMRATCSIGDVKALLLIRPEIEKLSKPESFYHLHARALVAYAEAAHHHGLFQIREMAFRKAREILEARINDHRLDFVVFEAERYLKSAARISPKAFSEGIKVFGQRVHWRPPESPRKERSFYCSFSRAGDVVDYIDAWSKEGEAETDRAFHRAHENICQDCWRLPELTVGYIQARTKHGADLNLVRRSGIRISELFLDHEAALDFYRAFFLTATEERDFRVLLPFYLWEALVREETTGFLDHLDTQMDAGSLLSGSLYAHLANRYFKKFPRGMAPSTEALRKKVRFIQELEPHLRREFLEHYLHNPPPNIQRNDLKSLCGTEFYICLLASLVELDLNDGGVSATVKRSFQSFLSSHEDRFHAEVAGTLTHVWRRVEKHLERTGLFDALARGMPNTPLVRAVSNHLHHADLLDNGIIRPLRRLPATQPSPAETSL